MPNRLEVVPTDPRKIDDGYLDYSEAFPLESIRRDISPELLRDLVVSYLGEYRYELTKETFSYNCIQKDGRLFLEDRDGNNIVTIAKRGVRVKRIRGLSSYKEEADVAGSIRLEEVVNEISDKDIVLWASPIDARAGYTYGFISLGCLVQTDITNRFEITTFRVDPDKSGTKGSSLGQYNEAFSNLTGEQIAFTTPNEFIENPIIINGGLTVEVAEQILAVSLGIKVEKGEERKFDTIILQMNQYISEFVKMFKSNAPESELQKAFYALENYFLKLKQKHEIGDRNISPSSLIYSSVQIYLDTKYQLNGHFSFSSFVEEYGRVRPPTVSGSCGSSNRNNLFKSVIDELTQTQWKDSSEKFNEVTTESYSFDHTGTCKRCKGEHKRLGPCDICEKCDQELQS